ncbi:MAG: DUF4007 family protein [Glaciecola sp.]|nr:DUF4007 family protein [Glaciecola sp.]
MRAKFSGHETFPLRYGWLYKSMYHIDNNGNLNTSNSQDVESAIVELGVGKNMVGAMRYWLDACSLLDKTSAKDALTPLAKEICFGEYADPNLEFIGTVWLYHFLLNFNSTELTSYRYFFNYFNGEFFEKNFLVKELVHDCDSLLTSKGKILEKTVAKDFDVFLSSYVKKQIPHKGALNEEELFVSPLSELRLIVEHSKGHYTSELKDRVDLPVEIFVYSLLCFAQLRKSKDLALSISYEKLLYSPFSPGRIFRLNEAGLNRLLDAATQLDSNITWTDSLGLRQIRIESVLFVNPEIFVLNYFEEQHYVNDND